MFESDFDDLGFKLGEKVRVRTSGLVGHASILYINLSMARQVYVESPTEDDKQGLSEIVDSFLCERVDDGLVGLTKAPNYDPEVDFDLGDEVRDRLTRVRGFAIQRVYSMSGCIRYTMQNRGKGILRNDVRTIDFDQARLRLYKSSKLGKRQTLFEKKDSGGPSIKGRVSASIG